MTTQRESSMAAPINLKLPLNDIDYGGIDAALARIVYLRDLRAFLRALGDFGNTELLDPKSIPYKISLHYGLSEKLPTAFGEGVRLTARGTFFLAQPEYTNLF